MPDILHRVEIKVFAGRHLSGAGHARRAGRLVDHRHARRLRGRRSHQVPLRVARRLRHEGARARPGERVLWQVVDGPAEWIGTKVELRPQAGRRLHRRVVQAPGVEGAGRVHAPLQHEVGGVPDEHEGVGRNRERRALSERRPHHGQSRTDVARRRRSSVCQRPDRAQSSNGSARAPGRERRGHAAIGPSSHPRVVARERAGLYSFSTAPTRHAIW